MVGGALGSDARHVVNVGLGRWLGAGFSRWTVFFVHMESFAAKLQGSQVLRTFLATGIFGGYTTFSAFPMDFGHLVQRNDYLAAGFYLVMSVVVGLLAFYPELWLIRWAVT
jgi:CrcB protein